MKVEADIVIAYRILLEMTDDLDTLREIARQAYYDWRMDRRTAMKIIVIATDRLLAVRRGK